MAQNPANPFLSSVNSGEFSPRMEARTDFERYPNAAKQCKNFLLLPEGGITRRPGTRYVAEVKDSSDNTILLPFQYSESDSWVLEVGDLYMRFFRRQAAVAGGTVTAAITNGTFTGNANGWSLSGWSYGSNAISSSTIAGTATQTVTVNDTGTRHLIAFETTGLGTVTLTITDGTTTTTHERAEGYHVVDFTPVANMDLTFTYNGSSLSTTPTHTLDNVSIISGTMELTTPYQNSTEALDDLRLFQAGSSMYILSNVYAPYRLTRYDTYQWSLQKVLWRDGPYLAFNTLESDEELFDVSSFQLIANPFFDNGLVGWTDASSGDGAVFSTANGAELDDGTIAGSGVATLRTSVAHPNSGTSETFVLHSFIVNQDVTLNVGTSAGATDIINGDTLQPGWNLTTITTSTATIHLEYEISGHSGERSAVSAAAIYNQAARLLKVNGTSGSVTLDAIGFTPFSSDDVGRLVRLGFPGYDPGYGIITAYSSTTQVTLQIIRDVPFTSYTEDWSLGAWGGEQGYPTQMGFFNGRLVLANTTEREQTLWFSQSGDIENFRADTYITGILTVSDSDAVVVTLQSKRIDPILWMTELNSLVLGTAGAQWVVDSFGSVITPADVRAKLNSAVPCSDIQPIDVSRAILFMDKSNREMYEIAYSEESNGYVPELVTILADHIFEVSPAHQMQYARRPHSTAWVVRDDGKLATLAYNRQHSILGWSIQTMGGNFGGSNAFVEHCAIIPGFDDASQIIQSGERDEVWVVVKRTIDGNTVRYVEFIEQQFQGPLREDYATEQAWRDAVLAEQEDAFYVDSGLTYDGLSTSTITGLDYLEGETVDVWADGEPQIQQAVSGGSITLNKPASVVQVGLPYDAEYISLKLAAGGRDGTAVNKVKKVNNCGFVLVDSAEFMAATIDQDDVQGRVTHDLRSSDIRPDAYTDLSEKTPLFSGETTITLDSTFSADPRVKVKAGNPGPFTMIGVVPNMLTTDDTQD